MVRHRVDTLNDAARQGYEVKVVCQSCGREQRLDPAVMMARLHGRGLSLRFEAIEERARCSACGARRAHVTPAFPED